MERKKIVTAKAGKPYLDLISHKTNGRPRKLGLLKGQIHIADDKSFKM